MRNKQKTKSRKDFTDVGVLEQMAKKEFLRHPWCKKVILIKHARTRGQKELPWGKDKVKLLRNLEARLS